MVSSFSACCIQFCALRALITIPVNNVKDPDPSAPSGQSGPVPKRLLYRLLSVGLLRFNSLQKVLALIGLLHRAA